jgi:hypothetical protein
MDIKGLQDILQNKLPEALRSFGSLEQSIAPLLSQMQQNRDKISPENAQAFDDALRSIEDAKKQMRENGYKNNK